MSRARSPTSVTYITAHADIEHPSELLSQMEKEHFIKRQSPSTWSPSCDPIFHLTAKAFSILLNDD